MSPITANEKLCIIPTKKNATDLKQVSIIMALDCYKFITLIKKVRVLVAFN